MALTTSATLAEERAHYLAHQHDKRVEEYRELQEMLPLGFERDAMQRGVVALADAGLTLVAARLQHYLLRLEAAAL